MVGDGRTRLVPHDLHTYCTLYCECMCMITSRCNQGAAADADAIVEQQLKQTKQASYL